MAAVLNIPTDIDERMLAEQKVLTIIPSMMTSSVESVIHERRNRLAQVRAVVAGALALAEAADSDSDVRYALELAVEPIAICEDAQTEDRLTAARREALES
jgi:hypothetical protein